ncbi:hypothetical protein TVAG_006980 [Trichomonas vaginalis G3]|uniref:BTB domain-containing protein n=1 Tax=Trichomonas vaginalis (strain ATCC PRA-98 / G3) TaxID=412133 RepID=A2FC21_TRIV3|nr:Potassium Channel Kv1.1, Chain A domain-containing protein [Trichomonas vaginalis G3]EAX97567.1 hypothetical protein TVAG_006980 [Trichomonas vaginalis G3]KAI5488103.1 Potassium Channel Kv1.1, Chain A domain-containing protein [Trichomonas vaginalis G3]|eukprot:XP_001310497.1 hypothetical protein [Trichomonas vaginalis G3]
MSKDDTDELLLTLEGNELAMINALYGDDFAFIIGKNEFRCNKMLASAFCSDIYAALKIDPMLDSFTLDLEIEPEIIQKFVNSFKGECVSFKENELYDLITLACKLNSDKISQFAVKKLLDRVNPSNAFKIIQICIQNKINYEYAKDYLIKNFTQVISSSNKNFPELSPSFYQEVINNPNLEFEPGSIGILLDTLYSKYPKVYDNFINNLQFTEKQFARLIEFCTDTNLRLQLTIKSMNLISKLINSVSKFDEMNLILPDNQGDLDGIFSYLTELTGGNPASNGTVSIFVDSEQKFVHDLIDFKDGLRRHYKNDNTDESNSIIFDFRNMRIKLMYYTIVSCYCPTFGCDPKDWDIYISDDDKDWDLVHSVRNDDSLCGRFVANTFEIPSNTRFCKYVKYVQLANHTHNKLPIIHLSCFELFGYIRGLNQLILINSKIDSIEQENELNDEPEINGPKNV